MGRTATRQAWAFRSDTSACRDRPGRQRWRGVLRLARLSRAERTARDIYLRTALGIFFGKVGANSFTSSPTPPRARLVTTQAFDLRVPTNFASKPRAIFSRPACRSVNDACRFRVNRVLVGTTAIGAQSGPPPSCVGTRFWPKKQPLVRPITPMSEHLFLPSAAAASSRV